MMHFREWMQVMSMQVNAKIYDLVHNEGDLTQKLDVRSGDS